MKDVLTLYKPVGQTPLQTIVAFQETFTEYRDQKLSYAGRLDPMAEGLLLVLVGEENKKRNTYEVMEKTYNFSVLFGITTDSYDLLGIPQIRRVTELTKKDFFLLDAYCRTKIGLQQQHYPPFSSKTVKGKPLYYWAREGKLNEITLPAKTITISSLTRLALETITPEDIRKRIQEFPPRTAGKFRQEEIITSWEEILAKNTHARFSLMTFSINCSSGTYVRSIAHEMGEYVKTGALAYSIQRIKIGTYTIADAHQV